MLPAFANLLLFQCLGEGAVFLLGLPVPGPVAGMVLLFISLLLWPALQTRIEAAANELLRHLSLLFVPAGVGIVAASGSGSGRAWPRTGSVRRAPSRSAPRWVRLRDWGWG